MDFGNFGRMHCSTIDKFSIILGECSKIWTFVNVGPHFGHNACVLVDGRVWGTVVRYGNGQFEGILSHPLPFPRFPEQMIFVLTIWIGGGIKICRMGYWWLVGLGTNVSVQ